MPPRWQLEHVLSPGAPVRERGGLLLEDHAINEERTMMASARHRTTGAHLPESVMGEDILSYEDEFMKSVMNEPSYLSVPGSRRQAHPRASVSRVEREEIDDVAIYFLPWSVREACT